jgi:hypothetical protein
MNEYENFRRISYGEDGATFIPVCSKCGRFVKADKEIYVNEITGLKPGPNATCSKCGRVEMIFSVIGGNFPLIEILAGGTTARYRQKDRFLSS